MGKKALLLIAVAGLIILAVWLFILNRPTNPQTFPTSQADINTKPKPADTFIEYIDPSGFRFSYPDNLSLSNNEIDDSNTYADIQLYANGVNGSLLLKIADSKFKSIGEWIKLNINASEEDPKETKLGDLEALEIRVKDRLLLGALDQGVLFTLEIPAVEEEFWMEVYHKILKDFSFVIPLPENAVSSEDIIFEGEEVVDF